MPANTVYVGRPSQWGNQFRVWDGENSKEEAVEYFRDYIQSRLKSGLGYPLRELKGKNLACWCKVGEPCHADVLLELANG